MINYSIDERNKLIFVKIKFHSNENIEWHCMLLELNPVQQKNWIELNNWIKIQLKRNRMQIGEGIKNLLGNMVLGKKKFKKHKDPKEHKFMALHLRMS